MPTILRIGAYRFFFYAEEGNESPHVHVVSAERRAKFWMNPVLHQKSEGFRSGELKEIEKIILENLDSFLEEWYEFFSNQ